MPPHPLHSLSPAADPSDTIGGAAARAIPAATVRDPWLASLLARRLTTLRERLGALSAWLANLPRRMRRAWLRRLAPALPTSVLILALAGRQAQASTITVDINNSGNCSLAEAIGNANDTTTGQPNTDCGAGDPTGADVIQFALANTSYGYTAALPGITTDVTIQGNGNTTIARTGGPAFSVLRATGGASLALTSATITGGNDTLGGGLFADGSSVSLTNATISGNADLDPLQDNGGPTFTHALTAGPYRGKAGTLLGPASDPSRVAP